MATASPNAPVDYEQAGELKIGQVGIANLRVRTLDVERLAAEMRERVARAPKLFSRRVDEQGNLVPRGTPGGTEEWFIPGSARREEMELAPDPSQDADPPEKR